MKMQMFVIRDTKAEVAIPPTYRENSAVAIRDFQMAVCAADNPMSKNPDDYVLYHVGEFDDETMYVTPADPQRVITGLEAVRDRQVKLDKIEALNREIEEIKGE